MEKSGSAIVVFSGWFLRKRVKQDEPEAMKACGPVATGRPVTAMLPCEMRRYIAGFEGEARKSGGVLPCAAENSRPLNTNLDAKVGNQPRGNGLSPWKSPLRTER